MLLGGSQINVQSSSPYTQGLQADVNPGAGVLIKKLNAERFIIKSEALAAFKSQQFTLLHTP